MVGVARFELATPAMSTQGIGKKRQFSVYYHGRRYGTCVEQTAKRRYFHRNYTGAVFPPGLKSKAPDPAATGSSADIAYQAGGHSIHTTASDSRQRRPILSLRFG